MGKRLDPALTLSACLLVAACVARTPYADSPCPCVEGYVCCEAVGRCGPSADACHIAAACLDLAQGVYAGTRWDGVALTLDVAASAGNYTSAVCDLGEALPWLAVVPAPERPYGKPLSAIGDAGYALGNFDPSSLVGLWHFEGAAGATAGVVDDASGIGNQGTVTGDVRYAAGRIGTAADFHGGVIEAVPSASLDDLPQLSVLVWVWPRTPTGILVSKAGDATPTNGWRFDLYGSGDVELAAAFDTRAGAESSSVVQSQAWTQVAATWDGSSDPAGMHLYAAGADAGFGGGSQTSSGARQTDVAAPLSIGHASGDVWTWDGLIDELALFSRQLSAAEIADTWLRGALRISYQVRFCDDPECAGVELAGPDGTAQSRFSEADNTGAEPLRLPLVGLTPRRYLQWRAYLETIDPTLSPRLLDMSLTR